MTRQTTKPLNEQLNEWLKNWLVEKVSCASVLTIMVTENQKYDSQKDLMNMAEHDELEIRLLPQIQPTERNGKYYEIQLLLLLEELNVKQIANLKTALLVIKDLQGLDFREGLGYMVQIYIMFNDFLRVKDKLATIYPTAEWDQNKLASYRLLMTDHNNGIELYLNREVIGLDELLNFWNSSGAGFSRGIFKNPYLLNDELGRISYLTIPPMWQSLKKLKRLYGSKFKLPKVPYPIEPQLIPLTERLPELSISLKPFLEMLYYQEKKKPEKKQVAKFPSPSDLRWREVTIEFVSLEAVVFKARDIRRKYTYIDLGFRDARKIDLPDSRWFLLRDGFAQTSGRLEWKNVTGITKKGAEVKAISQLRKKLKEIFGLKENPIYYDQKDHAYKTRFQIFDNAYK